ncbi:hypothetical protein CKA32_005188 [Geitlerinema sp. FC II]|nr:hypothetical protein CKA32_005188 [Geitlerinema sp. FC II]
MTYFFIGGAARTGTTVLNGILCNAPNTNPFIAEANYFAYVLSTYSRGKYLWKVEGDTYFDDLQDYAEFSRPWVTAFLDKTARRYGNAKHLVLKSPELTKYFPDLFELVSEAKFLMLLRDPRDAIASLLQVGDKLKNKGENPTLVRMLETSDMAGLAQFYNAYYRPCQRCRDTEFWNRTRYVQYEGLVRHPQAAIAQLEAFTGLSLKDFDPDRTWNRSRLDFDRLPERYRPWWSTPLYGKALSANSIGRYREVLTEQQIRDIERECADIFELGGYCRDEL